MRRMKSALRNAVGRWLFAGFLVTGLSALVSAQSDAAPPPPPPPPGPGAAIALQGPGFGGAFFHERFGEGKVVTGEPMTATITTTRDTTLSDGNTIHTEDTSTEYRDSQGRVRREVQFKLITPATGAKDGTLVIITDPVAGKRYVLNPQKKTVHEMPLRPPAPPPGAGNNTGAQVQSSDAGPVATANLNQNVTTESLGTKTILGLQAVGTKVTRTIPAGQIGNAKPIVVTTERWMSTELQIPLSVVHTDPMMGTLTTTVTSLTRGEPDPSLFQVPSDYTVESGPRGNIMYMSPVAPKP